MKKFWRSWFNTTNQSDNVAAKENLSARKQEDRIMDIIKADDYLSASQVHKRCNCNAPLTSIRRGMTNLKNKGLLIKTDITVTGIYGKPETIYKLA